MPPPVTCAKAFARPRSARARPEVEARRREEVVAVVVLVLEHAPNEREAVRVDAGRRKADHGVARARRVLPSITSAAPTMPTQVPAKSSSPGA